MTDSKRDSEERVLLLLVDGFAEAETVLYIDGLREAGLPLKTVGLTKRPVRSEHGVEIVPDLSLDEVIRSPLRTKLLILPRGQGGLGVWRTDPRMQRLLQLLYDQEGNLVATGLQAGVIENIAGPNISLSLCAELPIARPEIAPGIPVLVAPEDINTLLTTFVPKLVEMCKG